VEEAARASGETGILDHGIYDVCGRGQDCWRPDLSDPLGKNGRRGRPRRRRHRLAISPADGTYTLNSLPGSTEHTLHVKPAGQSGCGTHQGDFVARDCAGTISGNDVRITSAIGEVTTAPRSPIASPKTGGRQDIGRLGYG